MPLLRRALNLAPGEGSVAGLVALLMLATAAGQAMGGTATEALFFAHFDLARLPVLYVVLGAFTFACTLVTSALLARPDRARLYGLVPLALAATLALERLLATSGADWVFAVLWLAMNIITALQGIVAWGLAAAVCDTRQAKRLFPLWNAGKIAGTILGSFLTTLAVRVAPVEDLLLVWAGTLVLAFWVARRLRGRVARAEVAPESERTSGGLIAEMRRGFGVVRGSPLLLLLAAALVLFSVLYFSLALPFTRAARATYPAEADLAAFLGLFNGIITVASLVVSLALANRLYARFGVVNAIVGLGVVYAAAFGALALSGVVPALAAVGIFPLLVAARFAQLTWLTGVADTAYQALFNPVPPERRDQIRAFMEGVPGQAGIALAGVLLLVGDRLESQTVYLGAVVASAVTVVVLLRTRPAYGAALAQALRSGRPQPFGTEADPFGNLRRDADALRAVQDGMRDTAPAVRRVSAEVLRQLALPSTAAVMEQALGDADEEVRVAAVAGLAAIGRPEALAALREDPNSRVRLAARLATGASAASLLASDDPEERLAALAVITEARAVAGTGAVLRLLDDSVSTVRRAAVGALAQLDPVAAVEPLALRLRDADRTVATAALDALASLEAADARSRLELFAREEATVAAPDIAALRALGVTTDDERGSLLAAALRTRALVSALRAVRAILAATGRGGEGDALVLESLESADSARRASAVELLEALDRPQVVRPLLPLWERALDERVGSARALLSHPDPLVRACAIHAVPDPTEADLQLFANDPDELVRATAANRRDGGVVMETLATLGVMERILFLRRVPLFADLPPADLKQIALLVREELHPSGAILGREGEVGDRLFVIVSGIVQVVAGPERLPVARRGAGDPVGEMAIVADQPRVATLICDGEVRTLRLARREFEVILRDRPQVALAVMRVLAARLSEAQRAAAGAPASG